MFFSAYDPATSTYRSASVSVAKINKLLTPNSIEASEYGAKGAPTSVEALYRRLVSMLSIESNRQVRRQLRHGGRRPANGDPQC